MKRLIYISAIISMSFSVSLDCNGKAFLCVDPTRFYQCVEHKTNKTLSGENVYECPEGLMCDDNEELECLQIQNSGFADEINLVIGEGVSTEESLNFSETLRVYESSCNTDDGLEITTVEDNVNLEEFGVENRINITNSETNFRNDSQTIPSGEIVAIVANLATTKFASSTLINEIGSLETNTASNLVNENGIQTVSSFEIVAETNSTNKVVSSNNYVTDFVTETDSRNEDTTAAFSPTMDGSLPTTMETAVSTRSQEFICKLPGKFPDTKDCHTYHLCLNVSDHYIDLTIRCPSTQQYNPDTKRCTYFPVRCPDDPPLICPKPGKYPHPSDCSRYYKCTEMSPLNYEIHQFRCKDNKLFDSESSRCVQRFPQCFTHKARDFICPSRGRFPLKGNCEKFYLCKYQRGNFTYKMKNCWAGQAFDTHERRCKNMELVKCFQ